MVEACPSFGKWKVSMDKTAYTIVPRDLLQPPTVLNSSRNIND